MNDGETIGEAVKAMREVKWPSPAERYWATRLEAALEGAPDRVLAGKDRQYDDDISDPEWLSALRAELGVDADE